MKHWHPQPPTEDLSVAWCNANAAATSLMEAISFATPVMEGFMISTMAGSLARQEDMALAQRCRDFIHDESNHSRAHNTFNRALLGHLGSAPPALAVLRAVLKAAKTHLPLSHRLLLVAALEHAAAVLSMAYLKLQTHWNINSVFARELFAQHAGEELAHCSVAFDLWRKDAAAGGLTRASAVLAVLAAGLVYALVAAPWILYRKSNRRLKPTLFAMAGFVIRYGPKMQAAAILGELFSFARSDYHPDRLIAAGMPGATG